MNEKNYLCKPLLYVMFAFVFVLSTVNVLGQTKIQKKVSGVVTDAKSGETIVGANVWIKETTIGTVTNIDGQFSLSYSEKATVIAVSFMGYETQEIVVGNKSTINVKLLPNTESLEEIVIVGHGSQRKESVIGSISSVKIEKLKSPVGKLSSSLAGQLAGIVAVDRSGEPGSGATFYIRGISTFGANKNPLVLVDGVERSLDGVEPEDIASFSILKDATATAVYGVRGANGVILISTRRGENGKPKISVRAETGVVSPTKMPNLVNSYQFAKLYNEASENDFYSEEVLEKYKNHSDPDLYPDVNWIDELYDNYARNYKANVNVSGGGNIAKYFVSGTFYEEGSIFKQDNANDYDSSIKYKKYTFRANLDIALHKNTNLNINLCNVYETKNRPGKGDIWYYTFRMSPNAFPLRYSDGKFSGPSKGSGHNPYNLLMHSGYQENYWNSAQSLIGLTHDFSDLITPGLKANIKFSWDASNIHSLTRSKEVEQYLASGRDDEGNLIYNQSHPGSKTLNYSHGSWGNRATYLEASITYNRIFDKKHRLGGLFLFNQKEKNILTAGTSEKALPYRNQGIAGRITYSYKDKYFAEGNFGYNGSENFSPGNQFGFFPACALGWMVSSEDFFKPFTHVVDLLKIKGSYGIVGNDKIGGSRRFIYNATIKNASGYGFGKDHKNYGGIRVGEWANPNVGWEEATKTNIGLEISLFQQLKIQADLFHEKREGIFMRRASLPGVIGISTLPWVNVGEMENKGFDGTLQYKKKIGDFHVTARGNFTYTQNEILNNDEPDWKNLYQNRIGKPYGQPFGLIAMGLFEDEEDIQNSPEQQYGPVRPGDIKYKDLNEDGIINNEDEKAIGYPSLPQITYGFGGTVSWKGIDFAVFFQGVAKTSFMMSGAAIYGFSSGNVSQSNLYEDVYLKHWNEENPDKNAVYPRLSASNNPNNNRASTYWQRNGNFLRLKNLEIGYTIPQNTIRKIGFNSARIYFSGVNLLTFSSFDLWDVEMGGGQGSGYPPSKIYNLGVNVSF